MSVIIERDADGCFANAPELPGCHIQGATLDEVVANIREATELYLETLTKAERRWMLSKEILTTHVEVRVA